MALARSVSAADALTDKPAESTPRTEVAAGSQVAKFLAVLKQADDTITSSHAAGGWCEPLHPMVAEHVINGLTAYSMPPSCEEDDPYQEALYAVPLPTPICHATPRRPKTHSRAEEKALTSPDPQPTRSSVAGWRRSTLHAA